MAVIQKLHTSIRAGAVLYYTLVELCIFSHVMRGQPAVRGDGLHESSFADDNMQTLASGLVSLSVSRRRYKNKKCLYIALTCCYISCER